MFPIINHLDDLLPYISHKPEITVKKQPNGTTTVCYAISDSTTFDDEWARECRGITFDSDGAIICRSMHKFFNVNEREETQVNNIDWNNVSRMMDKRDGSMINSLMVEGELVCKTKKSFDTIQATRALEYINSHSNYQSFALWCAQNNFTPTFEWTSPEDRIVLKYNTNELVLTHIRQNVSGEYFVTGALYHLARSFNIPVVEDLSIVGFDISELIKNCETEELKEGYVIQFKNGDMVKLKTSWYINLHHSVTFTRERDIARMVVDETVDDFKSYLVAIGESLDNVVSIESKVLATINSFREKVVSYVAENYCDDKKTFALAAKPNEYFGMIMDHYNGKEPKYNEYFIKHFLKSYSLETV